MQSAVRHPDARAAGWQAREIEPLGPQESMQAAAEALAVRAGISLIIEGWPPQTAYVPTPGEPAPGKVTAEKALTGLADSYDYAWEVSRTGVVLLRKRFSDEHSRPELTEAELRAVAKDILAIVGRQSEGAAPATLSALRRAAEALPPELSPQLEQGGVPISALPAAQQQQALEAIRSHTFGRLLFSWSLLEAYLDGLPGATVGLIRPSGPPPPGSLPLSVSFPKSQGPVPRHPIALFRVGTESRPLTKLLGPVRAVPPALDMSLVRAYSVREAGARLSESLGSKVVFAPELLDRRLVLLLHKEMAPHGPAALAELHNWSLTRGENRSRETIRLRRRRPSAVRQPADLKQLIQDALPADLLRLLTTPPQRLNGDPVRYYRDPVPVPQQGPDRQVLLFIENRLRMQSELVVDELQLSLGGRDFSAPVPWSELSADHQRLVLYKIFATYSSNSVETLGRIFYGLPSYARDPLNARLLKKDGFYGITGPDGGGFLIRLTPL
ncbi:MAG: hypothetical protein ACK47B_17475 [Armatimonadota bacterium]